MKELVKVTDPLKVVTDARVLATLQRRGMDPDYVEFTDYGKHDKSKGVCPTTKSYLDLKTGKRIAVVSNRPRCRADGTKLVTGLAVNGSGYRSNTNLFDAEVSGVKITITLGNDQPSGSIKGDYCIMDPVLKIGGAIQAVKDAAGVLSGDSIEWDYGVCKCCFRVTPGRLYHFWTFAADPGDAVAIDYQYSGPLKLGFGGVWHGTGSPVTTKPLLSTVAGSRIFVSKVVMANAVYPVKVS